MIEEVKGSTELPVLNEYNTFEKALEGYFQTYFTVQEAKEACRNTKKVDVQAIP